MPRRSQQRSNSISKRGRCLSRERKKPALRILYTLHGSSFAGQTYILARAQKDLGHTARSLSFRYDRRNQCKSDIIVDVNNRNLAYRMLVGLKVMVGIVEEYDIYHFRYGRSLLPLNLDVPLLKALGKKVVFHFHGCDIRDRQHMLKTHAFSPCLNCNENLCNPQARWVIKIAQRYGDLIFCSTPDILQFVDGAILVPQPIDLDYWRSGRETRSEGDGKMIVLHAPTNRQIKGTAYIVEALGRLKQENHSVELMLVEGVPHDRVKPLYEKAAIVVDQVLMGWYCLLAVEGMALEKPVLSYIRDDLRDCQPDLPIIDTSPSDIYDHLKTLVENPALRRDLGARGRDYVERVHDVKVIAKQLIDLYESVH